jgi:hypothetical protein
VPTARPNEVSYDPRRLVRQVKQFGSLKVSAPCPMLDPCRLVRQVKEFRAWLATPFV